MSERWLGKYRLLGLLATGGMGEVWLAVQTGPMGFERRVVVKRILRTLAYDPEMVRLFLREARVAAMLSHPNVAQLIELGEHEGEYFIAMEFVRGVTWGALREGLGPLAPEVIAGLATQALHALHAAHTLTDEMGQTTSLVHRDLTPGNLMLSASGQVKVLDFGVAKLISASSTTTKVVRGSPRYWAPEQLQEGVVSPRTDCYQLARVLEELGGERLVPPVSEVVGRALNADPSQRWESAQAFATALERLGPELNIFSPNALAKLLAERFPESLAPDVPLRPPTEVVSERQSPQSSSVAEPFLAARISLSQGGISGRAENAREPSEVRTSNQNDATRGIAKGKVRRVVFLAVIAAVVVVVAGWWNAAKLIPSVGSTASKLPTHTVPPAGTEPSGITTPEPNPPLDVHFGELHLSPNPKTGRLRLHVAPWAEVIIGGRSKGVTPMDDIELAVGTHSVVLKNPRLGKEKQLNVVVKPGALTTVKADLLE